VNSRAETPVATLQGRPLGLLIMTEDAKRWLRTFARVLTVTVMIAVALAVIYDSTAGADDYLDWAGPASVATAAVALVALVLAWKWEGFGLLAIFAGVATGSLAAFEYGPILSLATAMAFTTPGLLFALAWNRVRTMRAVLVVIAGAGVLLLLGGGVAYGFHELSTGPAHPQSERTAVVGSAVTWVWSGGVTRTDAVVVARVEDASSVRLAYSTGRTEDIAFAESSLRGPVYRFELRALEPGASYDYQVEVDGLLDVGHQGGFTTWPTGTFDFTVAFAGCASTGSNGVVFDVINEAQPDLYIVTGDFFYEDIADSALDSFTTAFGATLTAPAQAALYQDVPIAYVWDDHDYGRNDSGATAPSRAAALASYRTIVPHYPFALGGPDAPIAQAFTIGPVRFIITDTRSGRTDTTALGEEQLEWFLDELTTSSRSHAVVIWVSSVPWLGEADPGGDSWAGFPDERALIGRHVKEHEIDNLLMLAGDAHMVAFDDGSNNPDGGFPVMHAAALDRPGSEKGGPFSSGAFPGAGQFGLLTVSDDGSGPIEIGLSGHTFDGRELLSIELEYPRTSP
jgi:PhoD-like phosphatase